MARLVVKKTCTKKILNHYDEIGLCAQIYVDDTLGSKVNTIERASVIVVSEPKSHFDPFKLLHLSLNDNLCD